MPGTEEAYQLVSLSSFSVECRLSNHSDRLCLSAAAMILLELFPLGLSASFTYKSRQHNTAKLKPPEMTIKVSVTRSECIESYRLNVQLHSELYCWLLCKIKWWEEEVT